jgi:hypothetical protein
MLDVGFQALPQKSRAVQVLAVDPIATIDVHQSNNPSSVPMRYYRVDDVDGSGNDSGSGNDNGT